MVMGAVQYRYKTRNGVVVVGGGEGGEEEYIAFVCRVENYIHLFSKKKKKKRLRAFMIM